MAPRGIRNNNPGNVEYGDTARSYGAIGTDGRFAKFPSAEHGIRAMAGLLGRYQSKYGLTTVSQMIGRWAPSFENNTRAYAAKVARAMGIHPDTPVDLSKNPSLMGKMIGAMSVVENGPQAKKTFSPSTISSALNYNQNPLDEDMQITAAYPSLDRVITPATNPRTVAPVSPVERGLLGPVQQTAFSTGGLLSPPKVDLSPVSSAQASPAQAAPAPSLARNPAAAVRSMPSPDVSRFGPTTPNIAEANQLRSALEAQAASLSPTAPDARVVAPTPGILANYSPISAPFSPTPASYQTPAFSTTAPKIDAFGQPPAPGLQPAVPSQYTKAPAPAISAPTIAAPENLAPAPNPALNQFPDAPKKGLLSGLLNPTTLASAAIGNAVMGPVGGLLGGLLGHSINNAGGLGGLLGGTYNGPTNNIGSGLGAISQVLGGAPVGTQAFSRSMPGMSVTSIPGGGIQRTNQYGVTQITTADGRTGRGVKGRAGGAGGNYGGIKSEGARNAIDHGIGGLF
jgi:hypothetical protein